jgi:YesN/AraC family two-component response regulator
MVDSTDMSTPVTRGELREELEHLRQEFKRELKQELAPLATKQELAQLATKQELAQLATKQELAHLATKQELAHLATKQELVPLATKRELELWGGALQARIETSEQRLIERIDGTERRLSAELARHVGAIHEAMLAWFAASDEKYADLPGRMSRLELAVFGAKQR